MRIRFFIIVVLLFVSCNKQERTISFGFVKTNWYGPMSEALSDFVAMNYRLPENSKEMISFIKWRLITVDKEVLYFGDGESLIKELTCSPNSLSFYEDSCYFVSPSIMLHRKEKVTAYSPRIILSKSLRDDLCRYNIYSEFIPQFYDENGFILFFNNIDFLRGINRINASFNSVAVQDLGESAIPYKTVFEKTKGLPLIITELNVDSTKTYSLHRDGSIEIINNNPISINISQRRLLTEFIDSFMVARPKIQKVCFLSDIYY